MIGDFRLRLMTNNQKRNYILKNKDKLTDEEILKMINSSSKGIAIFSSYDLSKLNISNNTLFKLLSELDSDETKISLYSSYSFGNDKFDLRECDDEIIINFINSFKNDEDKLKYRYDFKDNNKVFVEILKHIDNKIDFISQISFSFSDFLYKLYNYQKETHEYNDDQIVSIISNYENINIIEENDHIFSRSYDYSSKLSRYMMPIINYINEMIKGDNNKILLLNNLNLFDELNIDEYITLIENAKDNNSMKFLINNLKNKYNDKESIIHIFDIMLNNDLKKLFFKKVYFYEILDLFNDFDENSINKIRWNFKNENDKDEFLNYFISKANKLNFANRPYFNLFIDNNLRKIHLLECLKVRNHLQSDREVYLLLINSVNKHIFQEELNFLKQLPDIDKYLTKEELQYIRCEDMGVRLNIPIEEIPKYYTENGITEFFFQELFNDYNWDLINKIVPSKEINNYSLSDIDRNLFNKYIHIDDFRSKTHFLNYIKKHRDNIDIKHIDNILKLIIRISNSNSTEIQHMSDSVIPMLLETTNPFENLKYIEDVFIQNNLPIPAKLFLVYEKLYPGCPVSGNVSPVLKSKSLKGREAVIFSDLLKSALGSNNRSIRDYLDNIYKGNVLFKSVNMNLRKIEDFSEEEKEILTIFVSHLNTLYNNTLDSNVKGKNKLSGDLLYDIEILNNLFTKNGQILKDLPDRIVRMFGYLAGFNTYQEMLDYFNNKTEEADKRNRLRSKSLTLKKGDFIKGIGSIRYLENILQNGSVAKEFLGDNANNDNTPLDTDLSQIQIDGSIKEIIDSTQASHYGPIWFVIKNDGRFNITRTEDGEYLENIRDLSKLEIFYTGFLGRGHYGIRTGFASSEIDYIIADSYINEIALEIAINGFYIPIVNTNGELVFDPNDYDNLRQKMNGLSHYGIKKYNVNSEINKISPEIQKILDELPDSYLETKKKSVLIKQKIVTAGKQLNLLLKDNVDLNLGSLILFNTGSTSRYTNLLGDGDYDYTMQVDRNIYESPEKMDKLREVIINTLGGTCDIINGDIRDLETVVIDQNGIEYPVLIDITFTSKTNKTEYASDICVAERLNNIESESDKNAVIANIILAKKFLKAINAYKPARKDENQGGMGGIGVENWILQNGGTLFSAAKSFIEISDKCSSFDEFKSKYHLFNFGYNHMAYKKGFYPHDDYIVNMNSVGYEKMKKALKIYLQKYAINVPTPIEETLVELANETSYNMKEDAINKNLK